MEEPISQFGGHWKVKCSSRLVYEYREGACLIFVRFWCQRYITKLSKFQRSAFDRPFEDIHRAN